MFEGGAAGGEKARALRKELGALERAETSLDELIQSSTVQLKQLTEFKDSQRYPFTKLRLSLVVLCVQSDKHRRVTVVGLDSTQHIGLRDVPGHPLHRQSPGPDGHRCQGSC